MISSDRLSESELNFLDRDMYVFPFVMILGPIILNKLIDCIQMGCHRHLGNGMPQRCIKYIVGLAGPPESERRYYVATSLPRRLACLAPIIYTVAMCVLAGPIGGRIVFFAKALFLVMLV